MHIFVQGVLRNLNLSVRNWSRDQSSPDKSHFVVTTAFSQNKHGEVYSPQNNALEIEVLRPSCISSLSTLD